MGRLTARQMWAAKLRGLPVAGGTQAPRLTAPNPDFRRVPFQGIVLGIDPSLRGTGLAMIEFLPGRPPVLLRCQTVRISPRKSMAHALGEIHRSVAAFLADFEVRHVALEQTIYVQNFQTAQILGAARGAAISAAALCHREVFEYPPLRVKQAVVGIGRASKEQMARTVMALLGHGRTMASDEADAAGVALCHAFTWRE
ncbi:MAG: crossover junction endodeoxyribonuclease RuvC [Opitutaceae bacterium]|nr:crossover junction endodeoxyribonuclease RuvC [Opitutaceae bacterium]